MADPVEDPGAKAVAYIDEGSTGEEVLESGEEDEGGFGNRWEFVVSSIGSAVGLGNVWRFPWLVWEYGGGAFFVPYGIALFFIGIPLMSLEFSLAQIWRLNMLGVNHRISPRLTGAGILGIANSTLVSSFYSCLICWNMIYMVSSCFSHLPWNLKGEDRLTCLGIDDRLTCNDTPMPNGGNCEFNPTSLLCQGSTINRAKYFFADAANLPDDPSNPQNFSWSMFGAMSILWIVVFLALMAGPGVMGKLMYGIMALPTCTIFALLIIGVTLDGSDEGIKEYVGKWNGDILTEKPEVWTEATAQIFFSLSLGSAILMTFGSYTKRRNPCGQDAVIVSLCNCSYSFIAGFAMFAMAGHMAHLSGTPLADLPLSGSGLAFQTYPVGAGSLPSPWGNIVCFTFFMTLFLLGFASLVSLSEPVINAIVVSQYSTNVKRWWIVAGVCGGYWLIGLIYCADFGAVLLDEVDHYTNHTGMIGLGLINCIVVGWVYNSDVVIKKIGHTPVIAPAVMWFASSVFCTCIAILDTNQHGFLVGMCLLATALISTPFVGAFLTPNVDNEGNELDFKARLYWSSVANLEITREEINSVTAENLKWYTLARYTPVWTFLIKYFITAALVFLIGNLNLRWDYWDRSEIAPAIYTFLGASAVFVLGLVPFVLGMLFPWMLRPLIPVTELNAWRDGKGAYAVEAEMADMESKYDDYAVQKTQYADGESSPIGEDP